MRRMHRVVLLTLALMAAAGLLPAGLAGPAGAPALAQGRACRVTTDKGATPKELPLGYSTQVSLTVRSTCPFTDAVATRIVLAIDASAGTPERDFRSIIDGSRDLVRGLRLADRPNFEVAVLAYSPERLICDFRHGEGEVLGCLGRIKQEGGNLLERALDESRATLRQAAGKEKNVQQIVVAVLYQMNNSGCGPILSAASRLKGDGTRLITVGVDPQPDMVTCLQQAASAGDAHVADTAQGMSAVANDIAASIKPLGLLQVFDVLPANMRLVDTTLRPEPYQLAASRIDWRFTTLPAAGVTLTFWVTPLELGVHPTNQSAGGELVDGQGRSTRLSFPLPQVKVIDAAGLPTATPFPTPQPTPTVTPRPLAPTRTPAPRPTAAVGPSVCPSLARLVPAAAIADALANPDRIGGWGQRCNPGQPPSPGNQLRNRLSLQQISKPYHPLFNGLVFKCGCP